MIEVYRYFDNVTQIFFVSCISLSYPGQYLFSVVPGGKQLKLLLTRDTQIRSRIDMITELLHGRVLPSYRTIEDANKYEEVALDTREDCLEKLYSIETAYIEIR